MIGMGLPRQDGSSRRFLPIVGSQIGSCFNAITRWGCARSTAAAQKLWAAYIALGVWFSVDSR